MFKGYSLKKAGDQLNRPENGKLDVASLDEITLTAIDLLRQQLIQYKYDPIEIVLYGPRAYEHKQDECLDLAVVMPSLPDSPFDENHDFSDTVRSLMSAMSIEVLRLYPFSRDEWEGRTVTRLAGLIAKIKREGILIPPPL